MGTAHYDSPVSAGVIGGGDTSSKWAQYDKTLADSGITVGEQLAIVDKARK